MAEELPLHSVKRFPGSREWWNPEDVQQAIGAARSVAQSESPPRVANLTTGFGFWLQLMASFPELREVNIRRVQGAFAKRDNNNILKQIPGRGEDILLQRFEWDTRLVSEEFAVPAMKADNKRLCEVLYECNKAACKDQRYVWLCICCS